MSVSPTDRIVITGGAGFLGSFVVEMLRARGYQNIFIPRRKRFRSDAAKPTSGGSISEFTP